MKTKQILFIFTILTGMALPICAQKGTIKIVRVKLDTLYFYRVNIGGASVINGVSSDNYTVNNKLVSKPTYERYKTLVDNIGNCKPCYLKTLDINDKLIRGGVQYTDCGVGNFTEYYPNGKVKLSGEFKENLTGNWENISDRGYCNVADGQWTYFNENGDTLYSEFWKDNKFVKQVPEQKTMEIWNVELTLNGKNIEKQTIAIDQVKNLKITPKYKNPSRENTNLSIKIEVSAIGHIPNIQTFTVENFKNIDLLKMLKDAGISSKEKTNFSLKVYNNEKYEAYFSLDVKQ